MAILLNLVKLQSHEEINAEYVIFLVYESIPKSVVHYITLLLLHSPKLLCSLPLMLYILAAGMMQRPIPTVLNYDMTWLKPASHAWKT